MSKYIVRKFERLWQKSLSTGPAPRPNMPDPGAHPTTGMGGTPLQGRNALDSKEFSRHPQQAPVAVIQAGASGSRPVALPPAVRAARYNPLPILDLGARIP